MSPPRALVALVIAGAVSRWALLLVIATVPYVRQSGLGVAAGGPHPRFGLGVGAGLAAPRSPLGPGGGAAGGLWCGGGGFFWGGGGWGGECGGVRGLYSG